MIERIAREIYDGKNPKITDPALALLTGDALMSAVKENMDSFSSMGSDDETQVRWANLQQNNIYKFGLAKSYDQMKQMRDQVIDPGSGEIRPFNDFLEQARRIDSDYNRTYLKTEYDSVIRGTIMGEKWMDIEDQSEEAPYLQYQTMLDDLVREEHAELEGIIEPVDSAFWDNYYPPNGWNCRCSVAQLSEREAVGKGYQPKENGKNSQKAKALVDEYWRKNTGTSAIVEAEGTAYVQAMPGKGRKQLKAVDHYGLKTYKQISENANLPKLDPVTKEEFNTLWKLNESKGVIDLKDANGIPVRFDEGFYKHLQKNDRFELGGELINLLKKPDEIWAQQKGSRNYNDEWFKFYIRFYNEGAYAMLVDQKGLARTLYQIKMNVDDYRKGVLIKSK